MSDKSDHDLLVEMHTALVKAEIPKRVGELERGQAKLGVWNKIISAVTISALGAAVAGLFHGHNACQK